jgi:phosphoglycolate phosphatase-like HAD superfamily hydrolase
VWDWNGTLFDDQVAVVAAVNDALAKLGLPAIDADGYRTHFTRPVERFYEQVAGRPISAEEWATLDAAYHDSYLGRRGAAGPGSGCAGRWPAARRPG